MREKLKIFGTRLLQFVFHPLLVVCYAAIIVIECNVCPFAFLEHSEKELLIFSFMLLLFIFPMLFIIVLNKQNYIKTKKPKIVICVRDRLSAISIGIIMPIDV